MGRRTRRIIYQVILVALFVLLFGKVYVSDQGQLSFLWAYGGSVTLVLLTTFLVTFWKYRDPSENVSSASLENDLFVSCMVAVHNEEEHVHRCIDSMLAQSYKHKEIIVVDDASTDRTVAVLRPYAERGEIVLVELKKNLGKKRALTEAMKRAKGQIFAHTDSDSLWAVDAIERIVRVFAADPSVGAVSGHGRASNADKNLLTLAQDSWMEGQFSVRKAFESVFGAVTCVSGPLAVFRREAVFNYLPVWVGDKFLGQEFRFATDRTMTGIVLAPADFRLWLRARYHDRTFPYEAEDDARKSWRVLYSRSARSWTVVPDTLGKFLKQQIRWKKSFIRNSFFTGAFYWRRTFPAAAAYYLHILFVLMGPFVSFRHLVYLPVRGDPFAALLYLAGIVFVGLMFGIACKVEDREADHWIYRPVMSLLSTLVISWLVFYSAATIKKMKWHRG
ncbi:MAG: glycosyltransferase family 2 protein [Trueperaceae bacterium]|nr:glycosyltransferase family 2 protein [Trueperaceae bacterium]